MDYLLFLLFDVGQQSVVVRIFAWFANGNDETRALNEHEDPCANAHALAQQMHV